MVDIISASTSLSSGCQLRLLAYRRSRGPSRHDPELRLAESILD
jgi:hypothetical protein